MIRGPLTERQRHNKDSDRIARLIFPLPTVQRWIDHGSADDDLRDRRACGLIAVVADFQHNARVAAALPSVAVHREECLTVAAGLIAAANSLRALGQTPAAKLSNVWMRRRATLESWARDVEALGRSTQFARRANGSHAARNDFVRHLSAWVAERSGGRRRHRLVADVTAKVFGLRGGVLTPDQVRAILLRGE